MDTLLYMYFHPPQVRFIESISVIDWKNICEYTVIIFNACYLPIRYSSSHLTEVVQRLKQQGWLLETAQLSAERTLDVRST